MKYETKNKKYAFINYFNARTRILTRKWLIMDSIVSEDSLYNLKNFT